jgi:hypothetical protein
MNRRQFLKYTVALAVAAPLAKISLIAPAGAAALPAPAWTPTAAEVHEWLQYYKVTMTTGHMKFADAVATLLNDTPTPVQTAEEVALFQEAERAFSKLEADRGHVGWAHGAGYQVGRHGGARRNDHYTGPSNEGYSWYNGWLVGHNDLHGRVTAA